MNIFKSFIKEQLLLKSNKKLLSEFYNENSNPKLYHNKQSLDVHNLLDENLKVGCKIYPTWKFLKKIKRSIYT